MDYQISEHGSEVSSHKNAKKSVLYYEVILNIQTGDTGKFLTGSWPNIKIFWKVLLTSRKHFEWVKTDDGYIGEATQKGEMPSKVSQISRRGSR